MKLQSILLTAAALVCLAAACTKEKVKVQSVSLDKTSIELAIGKTETLVAIVSPDDADNRTVIWSSSDPSIVTVSNGTLTAVKAGEATITATVSGFSAECAVSVFYDCPAVDLGLSVKWASFNVGAQNESGLGSFFAWGETAEKTKYAWDESGDYKWGVYDSSATPLYGMTKYTADSEGGDGLEILLPEDDPATVNWGGKWRTPTYDEINELLDESKCEFTWDETKKGYTVRGIKTGNTIFLPAAGTINDTDHNRIGTNGYYWTSSVYESHVNSAYYISIDSKFHEWNIALRCNGRSIRAVTK